MMGRMDDQWLYLASDQSVPEVPVLEYFNFPAQPWHYDFARRVADALPSYPGFEARVAAGGIESYEDEDGQRIEVDRRRNVQLYLVGPTGDGRRFAQFSWWTRELVENAEFDLLGTAHKQWKRHMERAVVSIPGVYKLHSAWKAGAQGVSS